MEYNISFPQTKTFTKKGPLLPEIQSGSIVEVIIFAGIHKRVTVWCRDSKFIYFTDSTSIEPKRLIIRRLDNDHIKLIQS